MTTELPLVGLSFDLTRRGMPVTMPHHRFGGGVTVVALRTVSLTCERGVVSMTFVGTDPQGQAVGGPVDLERISDPEVRDFLLVRARQLEM